jgi:hypothetical protein
MMQAIYLIAFTCLLRFDEVLKIQHHHIEVVNPDHGHIRPTPIPITTLTDPLCVAVVVIYERSSNWFQTQILGTKARELESLVHPFLRNCAPFIFRGAFH